MHICKFQTTDGKTIEAHFNPEKGMNLMQLFFGDVEVMDQKTLAAFEERMAGMGALIGPHFHHRKDYDIPSLDCSDLFPYIEKLKEKGQKEFFSHGIARYVPWKYEGDESSIRAKLSGADVFKGYKLSEIEGQNFELIFSAKVHAEGLTIEYSMEAEKPSVIGFHYYYGLPDFKGKVLSKVASKYHHPEGWKDIPKDWIQNDELCFKIDQTIEADFGFRPQGDQFGSSILLETSNCKLSINYESLTDENAWQLYHPKDASYVCIEPVTAKNPREASLKSAHIKLHIQKID